MAKVQGKLPGLEIGSCFVGEGEDPFSQVQWVHRDSCIKDFRGQTVYEFKNVEVPEFWSQLATDILASKYLRKSGVPQVSFSEMKKGQPFEGDIKTGPETSLKQVVLRIAKSIRDEGVKQSYFKSEKDADTFANELIHILIQQKAAFNSPVWFNCGLSQSYGIRGNSSHYALIDDEIQKTEEAYKNPQCSACFIQSVDDSMDSIFQLAKQEALIFKYGSGSGTNFSAIRSKDEPISGGGRSSGLLSFLKVLDAGAGATRSGGITRRSAKMVCLDIDHPEIVEFIQWKAKEEKKAQVLIAAGFDSDFNGEAYGTVSGQNSNNSVRVPDEFMETLRNKGMWSTYYRLGKKEARKIPAEELWSEIAQATWECADPGLQFDSTIQKWHTCKSSGRINSSNPCSEYMFLDNSACNLASLNLLKFLDEGNRFLIDDFLHSCRIMFIAQEILVGFSSYPTQEIAENSNRFRPLGLGFSNLGAFLMVSKYPYDSDEARNLAGLVSSILTAQAYLTSTELAAVKGAFVEYDKNKESCLEVLNLHTQSLERLKSDSCYSNLLECSKELWQKLSQEVQKYGLRNAQASVVAPTGTIGLLMDCDTTGVEPDYSIVKYKKLSGGGNFKIVNKSLGRSLENLGYDQNVIEEITQYVLYNENIENAPQLKKEHVPIFDCANTCGPKGSRFIAPKGHIEMMAAIQPFISGAISKTVNLPNKTDVEEIKSLFLYAWEVGTKAVAFYRDGSKLSQPLSQKIEVPADQEAPTYQSDSPQCSVCGFKTIRSGSCFKCLNCGQSEGCS